MLFVLGSGGSLAINSNVINDIASGSLTPVASWVVFLVVAAIFAAMTWFRDARRRKSGLVAPPASVSLLKIAAVFAAGVAIVLVCNTNRGNGFVTINGVPWVLLLVLAVLAFNTVLLNRTRFGRYLYAIGGNAEAARRGGVNLMWMRTSAFALAALMAGVAGIVYASRLRSVSTNFDGGTLVLYAIAAAVIGGTSLFGGRRAGPVCGDRARAARCRHDRRAGPPGERRAPLSGRVRPPELVTETRLWRPTRGVCAGMRAVRRGAGTGCGMPLGLAGPGRPAQRPQATVARRR